MFDIGFSEVLVIFILALIVLGPEKLPKVAAQVGRWIGRARGMARQFREQLEEEVNLEEIRRSQQSANRAPPPPPPQSSTPAPSSAVGESTSNEVHPSPTSGSAESHADTVAALRGEPAGPNTASGDISPTGAVASFTPPPEPEQPVYPDTYSHAHPTDSLGRPVAPPTPEPPPPESGQQDWVEGVTGAKK